jgi:hypothetical protein
MVVYLSSVLKLFLSTGRPSARSICQQLAGISGGLSFTRSRATKKMTEVGVSLALRRQNKLLHSEEGTMKKSKKFTPSTKTKKKKRTENKSSNSSWQIFIEGASLYALCLVLPNILGLLVRWYQQSWLTFAGQACSLTWLSNLQWCIKRHQQVVQESISTPSSLTDALAPDAGVSDVGIVVLLSLSMAVIRLALVHFLVPNYNQPKRLEALVRCKSIHLLSSSYPGTVTPRSSLNGKSMNLDQANSMLLAMPDLGTDDSDKTPASTNVSIEPKRLFDSSMLRGNSVDEVHDSSDNNGYDLGGGVSGELGQPLDDGGQEEEDEMATAPAVSSGLMTSSSALSLQALLHQAAPMTPTTRREIVSKEEPDRIFAAPKYATAVFRLLFCSTSCIIALFYFLDADFWPPAVGGSGSTKNCWDLSSVGAAVMDSDFDQHNTVLRRYYLLQLSYHFHSGAFHVLATLLLWFVSSSSKEDEKPRPKTLGFIPAGMWTIYNVQSLFQHCFAVGVIALCYLFSSLRRLGVIAAFAFDFSSWFLHLLQICINVPNRSRHVSPFWIRMLHRGFVIPAFCYSRFYIFPFVIGYSALEESQDWLRQLENMLVPGLSKYFHGWFVVSFCLLMMMNLVYVRRLLYHSHVKEQVNRPK